MANPQIENGYTKISNELLDAIIRQKLSGHEFRIAMLVIRKTYGYNKKQDAISLSQMAKSVGISKIRCSQVINRLQLQKIVTVTENINGIVKKYLFNKDYEQWVTVTEKCNRIRKVNEPLRKSVTLPLQKTVTTKESIKDNIQKKKEKDKDIVKNGIFHPPTISEISEYCLVRKNWVDPDRFHDFYTSNGWKVGKNKMKDWKAAVRTWEKNEYNQKEDLTENRIGRW